MSVTACNEDQFGRKDVRDYFASHSAFAAKHVAAPERLESDSAGSRSDLQFAKRQPPIPHLIVYIAVKHCIIVVGNFCRRALPGIYRENL